MIVFAELSPVQQRLAIFLAVLAGVLLAALVLLVNVARAGGSIAAEIRHAQDEYMDFAQGSPRGEVNALQLGQCLRRAMLKVALTRVEHGEAWLATTRVKALPACQRDLPPLAKLPSTTFSSALAGGPDSIANGAVVRTHADQRSRR